MKLLAAVPPKLRINVLFSLALVVTPSLAQSGGNEAPPLETITVLGAQQAYQGSFNPLETPQAELVIDEQTLRNAGAADLDQALDLSASVSRQNNFGGLWNSFALRGFVGDENLPSNYLVNGFNAGRGFGGPRDLSSIDSVQVLKGPRAALFGRGEPGGTVNLVTKRPTFGTEGEVRLSAAQWNRYRTDADWTSPVSDDVAVRAVGYYEQADSFRDTIETERYGASPSIAWRLSEHSQLVYELEYSHQKIPLDRGVLTVDGELGVIPKNRFLGEPGDGPMEADVLGHQFEFQHHFSEHWNALLGVNHRDTRLEGFSTEAELAGSRQPLYLDGETLSRQRRFRDYDTGYSVLRGELSGRFDTGRFEHRILIGADMDRFEDERVVMRARPPSLASDPSPEELYAINIFAPIYGQYPLPTTGPLSDRVESQESIGLFIQDQIGLTDRLDMRIGARFDDYQQKIHNKASDTISQRSETRTSPQLGLVFQATDTLSLYTAYGENFRPLSGTSFEGNHFDPNTTTSIEGGVKFVTNDGTLVGTASIFHIQQENILVSDPDNAGFSIAAGQAESRGLEVDLQGEIAPGLNLWFSYTFVDAEVSNDVFEMNFGSPIQAGDRLLNIPEHSASVQISQDWMIASRPFSLGGGLLYVGDRLGEVATDFELPAYTLARVFASYRLSRAVALRAEVNNVFDQTYYSNSFSQLWVQPGTPRNVRLTAEFRF